MIQGNVETTDLKYPAVTLCPKVTTRWGIVERLGNYIDPLNLPEEFLRMRNMKIPSHILLTTTIYANREGGIGDHVYN